MIKLGVTGNIACGKSLVETFLNDEGVPTIDADRVVYELYTNDQDTIKRVYDLFISSGVDVRDDNGTISQKKLSKVIFEDKEKLKELEKIVHPKVIQKINVFFNENQDKKITAAVVPLIYEAKMQDMFDKILLVIADKAEQVKRLMKRNEITFEQAQQKIDAQIPQEVKIKLADFVIDNTKSQEATKSQLQKVLNKLSGIL